MTGVILHFPCFRDPSPPVEVKRPRVDEQEGFVLPPRWMMANVGKREVLDPTIVDLDAPEEQEATTQGTIEIIYQG